MLVPHAASQSGALPQGGGASADESDAQVRLRRWRTQVDGGPVAALRCGLGSAVSRSLTECSCCCAVIAARQMRPSCRLFNEHINNVLRPAFMPLSTYFATATLYFYLFI